MNVLICGSRENYNKEEAKYIILGILLEYHSWDTFITGGATGIDTQFESQLKRMSYFHEEQLEVIKPNYAKFKKSAPIIRNKEMVDKADIVYALWNGISKGTEYTINYANEKKKEVVIYEV